MALSTIPLAINFKWAGLNIALPDMTLKNRKIVVLQGEVDISSSPLTMHENGTNYQVPVGKNSTLLGVFAIDGLAARTIIIFSNDLADNNATQVDMISNVAPFAIATQPNGQKFPSNMSNAPSSKFINHNTNASGGGFWTAYFLEEDN